MAGRISPRVAAKRNKVYLRARTPSALFPSAENDREIRATITVFMVWAMGLIANEHGRNKKLSSGKAQTSQRRCIASYPVGNR